MHKISLIILFLFSNNMAQATSMYSESTFKSLVSDHIAGQVGDSVTILIYETATASASNNTDTSRKTDFGISSKDNINTNSAGLNVDSRFNGGGDVNRTGNLLAKITARVTRIEENGEMLIEGQQYIELNEDKQTISLTGRIRKEDIEFNNTVVSTRIADAKIKYITEGALADRQKPGWITRVFDWLF